MIDVLMTCYFPSDAVARQLYAVKSLDSLSKKLISDEAMRLVVADDSEQTQPIVTELLQKGKAKWTIPPIYSRSYHQGIGASLNRALEQIDGLWLYTTDDWRLTGELDLAGPSKLLRQGYDLVRLGPVHPDLECVTRFQAGIGWWLDLRKEYGGFAFATRPFLATKEFYKKVGPFDEKLNSYETERLYAERVAKLGNVKLAYWGGVDLAGPWEHLGLVEVGYREVV